MTPVTAPEPIFWTWVRVLRRAELGFGTGKKRIGSNIVQHVAMMACTYGNPDGSRIRPGLKRLARVCRLDPETVRRCLARLRELGLFRRVFEGAKAGRAAHLSDEYQLEIPDDLAECVAMLDPDESELIVPDGVEPPPTRTPRTKRAADEDVSPGAAPADGPVDNSPEEASEAVEAASLGGEHPVLPPVSPGAAPETTRCSTAPPTHAPPNHLPDAHDPPYGAEVEGETAGRREPPAESVDHPPPRVLPRASLREINPEEAYAAAAAELATLPEFGHTWITAARQELGEHTPRTAVVIRAHALYAERSPA